MENETDEDDEDNGECSYCGGSGGGFAENRCPHCKGTGYRKVKREFMDDSTTDDTDWRYYR